MFKFRLFWLLDAAKKSLNNAISAKGEKIGNS